MTALDSGRRLPHHDHIAQVVTVIEAAGRGLGGWDLELESDGALSPHDAEATRPCEAVWSCHWMLHR